MTVKELYKLCEDKMLLGYGDCNIVLCVENDKFYPLENKFSSPVYNNDNVYDTISDMELLPDEVIVLN